MRYEVVITLNQKYILAVEADDTMDAQGKALDLASVSSPEYLTTHIEIERGVQ